MAHAKQVAAVRQLWPLLAVDEIDRWLAMLRTALSANYDRLDTVLSALSNDEENA